MCKLMKLIIYINLGMLVVLFGILITVNQLMTKVNYLERKEIVIKHVYVHDLIGHKARLAP